MHAHISSRKSERMKTPGRPWRRRQDTKVKVNELNQPSPADVQVIFRSQHHSEDVSNMRKIS